MSFHLPSTRTLYRGLRVHVENLEVRFAPLIPRRITGGLLRRVRRTTPILGLVVALLFSLDCARPQSLNRKPAPPAPPRPEAPKGPAWQEEGLASWYGGEGDGFAGRHTASGEIFDPERLSCAHRTLPFGTLVEVENLATGRKAQLTVTDRGPFARRRVLDVSRKGAQVLGFLASGTARVRLRAVDAQGRPLSREAVREPANPYTIQVASLRESGNAQRLSQELRDMGQEVQILPGPDREGRTVQRVLVGAFLSSEEAGRTLEQLNPRLRERGLEPFVTRRR